MWSRVGALALATWLAGAGVAVAGDCPTCGHPGTGRSLFLPLVLGIAGGQGPLIHRGVMLLANVIKTAGGPERPVPAETVTFAGATPTIRGGMDLEMLETLFTPPVRPTQDASPAALRFVATAIPDH